MAYKITIEKIESKVVSTRAWKKLRDDDIRDPMTGKMLEQYGYVDNEEESTVETTVFEQLVDNMNIKKVIKAINDLEVSEASGGAGGLR